MIINVIFYFKDFLFGAVSKELMFFKKPLKTIHHYMEFFLYASFSNPR